MEKRVAKAGSIISAIAGIKEVFESQMNFPGLSKRDFDLFAKAAVDAKDKLSKLGFTGREIIIALAAFLQILYDYDKRMKFREPIPRETKKLINLAIKGRYFK